MSVSAIPYMYLHPKSTKNFFRANDPVIDELTTRLWQTPDRGEQRALAKKIVDREYGRSSGCGHPTTPASSSSSRGDRPAVAG